MFKNSYSRAFSTAFDVYIELLYRVDRKLDVVLGVDKRSRLQRACPSCLFEVDYEEQLPYSMLLCVDGNDSLKRLRHLRRKPDGNVEETVVDVEREDRSCRESSLYLEDDFIDKYKYEVKRTTEKVRKHWIPGLSE